MSDLHGGDRVAEVLRAQGVRFLFTLCGGHISPILVGARRRGIRVVDVRHEVNAVFAADAVARLSGTPGVAAVTAGPGATNTITALKNAQLAQSPVVLLVGAAATVLRGRGSLQDIDQMALFEPHCKRAIPVKRVRQLVGAVEEAFYLSREGVPGPVVVECPIDLLYGESLVREWYIGKSKAGKSMPEKAQELYLKMHVGRLFLGADLAHPGIARVPPAPEAEAATVAEAAARLEKAERPVILVGSQTLVDATQVNEVARAVERVGAPVYLSGMGRGLLGKQHPLVYRHKRREALREADLVMLSGVPADFRLDYGRHIRRNSFLISANRSRDDMQKNRKPQLGALGDAGRFLRALADRMPQSGGNRWPGWRDKLAGRDRERETEIDQMAALTTDGLNPVALCRAIEGAMAEDSAIVADGGDFVATASYTVSPRKPLRWLDPGVFGTLGVGAGFALGAKLVYSEAEVWIIYGDGSVGYSLAEFDTFTRHKIPVIAVVGNDASWMQIARDQIEILKDDVGTVLRHTDYHVAAEGLGGRGLLLKDPAKTAETLAEAKAIAKAGQPVLINAIIGKTEFRKGSISM